MFHSNWRSTIYTILIAVVFGTASGIFGTAWTSSYLSGYAVQLNELTNSLRLSPEKPRNFPSSYKEAVEGLIETALPSVVEVYTGTVGELGYQSKDRTHIGVVLTSDGWLAIPTGVVMPQKTARVRIRGQMYPIVESIFDSVSNVLFVKVDANDLPVVAYGKGRESRTGEQVFVATGGSEVSSVSMAFPVWPRAIAVSSDSPNRVFMLDQAVQEGSIVFNLSGDLIGLTLSSNQMLPIEVILPALRSLLEQHKIIRPSLGVLYVDLTYGIDVSTTLTRGYKAGALLSGASSVTRGGAAYQSGIRANDILLSINTESINGTSGLDELIEQYRPGDIVQVLLDRAGETQIVEVQLGESKEIE